MHKRIDIRTGNGTISCDYIQGSADDHELWVPSSLCNGKFGADVFWSMAGDLLEDGYIKCGETELIEKINSLYNPWMAPWRSSNLAKLEFRLGSWRRCQI